MHSIKAAALALTAFACITPAQAVITTPGKQIEDLNRGVIAMVNGSSKPFITWRLLGTDPSGITFNVYRGTVKLTPAPIALTNFTDSGGTVADSYSVRPVINGVEQAAASAGATWAKQSLTVPLQKPAGGVTPAGVAYEYEVSDGSAVDLDGDGTYEIVFIWAPTNAEDNSVAGYTGNTYIDAVKLDGTRMWRIDLGRNIRAGAHYSPFVAYDLDGDGQGEVMVKTGDGTVDGIGVTIGSATADHRNGQGYILTGPEYLTVFNGLTGAAMKTVPYLPARGNVADWGDNYGNRADRFLAGVANLDGARPSAIFSRGYYTRAVIAAWDWRDGQLSSRWVFDSNVAGQAAAHQGAHWFSVADVDSDGKDDIVYGAATISSYGQLMYSTNLCHGDALHVGKFNPNRAGQQVFMVHETPSCYGAYGMEMHDAATGQILWGVGGGGSDVGRGTCMDIDPAYPGEECWSTIGGVRSATGALVANVQPPRINFAVWWDGDLLRESLDIDRIDKWNPSTSSFDRLLTAQALGAYAVRGSKAQPVLSADLFGDWREEIVWRTLNSDALMIFSTMYPSSTRMPTLMHNPQYRAQVAGQNAGYNQPPHPSFYLGHGATSFPQEPVHIPFDGRGVIQAETAILGGGALARSDRGGYRGTGFLSFRDSGSSAQFNRINGGSGGARTISVRYANGGTTVRTGVLRVNGVAHTLTFPMTGSWTTWATLNVSVTLAAGRANTLRFESTGQSLGILDELTVP